jgi:ferric-dicitrate binding protein FerR (iron transport regulator)
MERKLLYKYFSGETIPAEEKMIIDWAEASPENYRTYLNERKIWDAVLVNFAGIAGETAGGNSLPGKMNLWKYAALAASFALLFALFYPRNHSGGTDENWQSVWAPPGQRTRIVLDDSTVVWLNSQSTLTFPSSFASAARTVKLKGEGYFEVKKDEGRSFTVQTSHYDISVQGTSFNVFAYENNAAFETSLLNGSVRVLCRDGGNPAAVSLLPNEKVTEIDGRLVKSRIDNFDRFRWRDGLLCFDDEPFGNMIKMFSLYFDISISITNPALLEYRPTGKFRQSDGVDHALKVLQRDMGFTYSRDNEKNEIVIK